MGSGSPGRWGQLVIPLLLASWIASPSVAAPRSRALLIGINEYRSKAIPDLRGALNDVELMRSVLTTRFGFADEDIEVLTDEAATRKGILAALERFAARAGPDDRLYVHYSGHGSQVRDAGGDETSDRMDETLVPHDGRTTGVPDITDDELAERLSSLPTPHVVVVLDSCHAGTATRSLSALRTRRIARDERLELYPESAARAIVPLTEGGHLLMTGAAHDQEALDGPVDGRVHGFFSYALAQSMSRAGREATPRELFRGVETELERVKGQLGLSTFPTPQLEGTVDRLEAPIWPRDVEAGEQAARVAWVAVEPEPAQGRVRLVGGLARGAVRGSHWAIHPPGDQELEPGSALALARVVELADRDAIAVLEPAGARVPSGSRAVAAAPPPVPSRVGVRLVGEDAEAIERLRNGVVDRFPAADFVEEGEFARFHVRIGDGECTVFGADAASVVEQFAVEDEAQVITALVAILARSMNVAELLSLDHPSSGIRLEIERVGDEPAAETAMGDEGGVVLVARTRASRARIARPGGARSPETSLQVRVRSDRPCFLTLVDVDSEGGVNLLFPNPLSTARRFLPEGELEADRWYAIPDSLEPGNRAGFYVDFAEPPGDDTLRAFCAAESRVAAALRETIASMSRPPGEASADARGHRVEETASIFDRARRLLTRSLGRGMKIVAADDPSAPAEPDDPPAAEPDDPAPAETEAAEDAPGSAPAEEAPAPEGGALAASSGSQPETSDAPAEQSAAAELSPGADWAAATLHIHVTR